MGKRLAVRAVLLLAGALAATAGCGGSDPEPDAGPSVDASTASAVDVSWSIVDGDGNALACADVAATRVVVVLRPRNQFSGTTASFSCASGSGRADELLPDTYDLTFRLNSAAGTLTELTQTGVVLGTSSAGEQAVTFAVEPRGNVEFTLATLASGGNCADPAEDGAGIATVELRAVRASSGDCVPTTFDVGGQIYETMCDGEVFDGCIENDVPIAVTGAPSGSFRLQAVATDGDGRGCLRADRAFVVPGADLTTDLGPVNVRLDQSVPGCGPEEESDASL